MSSFRPTVTPLLSKFFAGLVIGVQAADVEAAGSHLPSVHLCLLDHIVRQVARRILATAVFASLFLATCDIFALSLFIIYSLSIKLLIPLGEAAEAGAQGGVGFEAEVALQCRSVRKGHRHIARLHRHQLLM